MTDLSHLPGDKHEPNFGWFCHTEEKVRGEEASLALPPLVTPRRSLSMSCGPRSRVYEREERERGRERVLDTRKEPMTTQMHSQLGLTNR